ncbi:MAG: hypothetical protein LBK98_04615 [Peptococcaceae bacterium]|jgi:hypothetical protein|nr:hypothetical protein [Peptococcaceae bacterium]
MRGKSFLVCIFLVIFTVSLSGCGGDSVRQAASSAAQSVANTVQSVAELLSGDVTGEVGKTYATQWFEFTIESIEEVSKYAGYTPEDGYVLYDVLITEKGTFDEPSPMGTYDFYMDAPDFYDYVAPMGPLSEEMMPEEFDLAPDQIVEYHMVYEIPADTVGLKLMYTEWDSEDNEGNTFTIPIS